MILIINNDFLYFMQSKIPRLRYSKFEKQLLIIISAHFTA